MQPDDPLSIGVVIHDFALGGTERVAVRLARRWAELGHKVTIFCGSSDGPLTALAGQAVTILPATPAIPRGRGSRERLGRALVDQLTHVPTDILFVPGNFHWPVVRHVAAMGRSRPRIAAQISAALRKPQRGRVRQWIFDRRMARLLRPADAVIAMTDADRACAEQIIGAQTVHSIPTPALDDTHRPLVAATNDPGMLLAVGRLVPEKGFATLIEALSLCASRDCRLVILGSGPDEGRLRNLAHSLAVADRVELVGFVPDSRPWLDRARLFILSSWFEGYPAVLVEALAAGRPVVSTDCTRATDLLTRCEGAGRVVRIRDAPALAAAIDAMLAQAPPNPEDMARLVEEHRLAPVADRYLQLFRRMLAA